MRQLKSFFTAAVLTLLTPSPPTLAEETPPAYLVATLEVTDLAQYFDAYGTPVFPLLAAAGAEVLVATPSASVLEGTYLATWTAIVKFPSMAALQTWYASDEYQALAPARRVLSNPRTSVLIAAPAFEPPAN